MKRYYFEVEDEEMIRFLDRLKRKRSLVMRQLVSCLMEATDEYAPVWVMSETNFIEKITDAKVAELLPNKSEKEKTVQIEVKEEKEPIDSNAKAALAGLSGFMV